LFYLENVIFNNQCTSFKFNKQFDLFNFHSQDWLFSITQRSICRLCVGCFPQINVAYFKLHSNYLNILLRLKLTICNSPSSGEGQDFVENNQVSWKMWFNKCLNKKDYIPRNLFLKNTHTIFLSSIFINLILRTLETSTIVSFKTPCFHEDMFFY